MNAVTPKFGLSTEGALMIEYGAEVQLPIPVRLGLLIPAEEVENLRRALEATKTIQETLSAKKSDQGAH
jgi:hypothetical protein